MNPESTEDVLDLMNGSSYAAVLNAAMELGIFWLLDEKPLSATQLAQSLHIPLNRCHYLLQILCRLGLLENNSAGYAISGVTRDAILKVMSQETWAFQAYEDRELSLHVRDLALNIDKPMPDWQALNLAPAGYIQQIEQDPIYTERFTRKLYQIHSSLSEQLANMLDLRGVKQLLDLGGGSGVVSFALLRKYAGLISVVMDVESVCQAGRVIARENKLENRISYIAADFMKHDLPTGYDRVMLCDVGCFGEILFHKIHAALLPRGRLIIVDKFAQDATSAPPSRLLAAFLASLESPAETIDYITIQVVQARLQNAGFRDISATPVPHKDNLPWNIDWTVIEAQNL